MQSQRLSSIIGTLLTLLGSALFLYSVFSLPMVFGNGGGSFTPHSEWEVANTGAPEAPVGLVLLALILLSMLFVLITSAASFFRRLSPGIVTASHIAAITALFIQGPLGFLGGGLYAFGAYFGAGNWLAQLGCAVVGVGHLAQFGLSKVLQR